MASRHYLEMSSSEENSRESLKKLIDDDLLFDAIIKSRNVIIQEKIQKGETVHDMPIFSTTEEISGVKEGVIEQFNKEFDVMTMMIISGLTDCLRRKYKEDMRSYTTKKRELKDLVDSCTEYAAWADILAAINDLIMLQRRCEVHKELAVFPWKSIITG